MRKNAVLDSPIQDWPKYDVIRTFDDDKLIKEQEWSYKELSYSGKEAAGGGLTLSSCASPVRTGPVCTGLVLYKPATK
jgi:hypothetical protein